MSEATPSQGTTWLDILQTGVSGLVDAQIARNYSVGSQGYNTQAGAGGQPQPTPKTTQQSNQLIWIAGGAAALVVLLLVMRR